MRRTVATDFAGAMNDVARALLGEPNKQLSTARELRFGSKGSISVDLARGIFFDYEAGSGGGAIDLIRRQLRCDVRRAIEWMEHKQLSPRHEAERDRTVAPDRNDQSRIARGLTIWREARAPEGSLVEAYLASRSLVLPPGDASSVIRFHPLCPFGPDGERLPCMVALMRDILTDAPVAIHRTPISDRGRLRDAKGEKIGRRMLGRSGGAAIKVCPDPDIGAALGIAEGLETALAVIQSGWAVTWALGSAGAIGRFPVLPGIDALTVFADNDTHGEGYRSARAAAERWAAVPGKSAFIQTPPAVGCDFNDLLMGGAHV